jgi:hypothetical protein
VHVGVERAQLFETAHEARHRAELAQELLSHGLVKETEIQPMDGYFASHEIPFDADKNIILNYWLFPNGASVQEAVLKGFDENPMLALDLDTLIDLASNCSNLREWLYALLRNIAHHGWKFLQNTDISGMSKEDLQGHIGLQKIIEQQIEPDRFGSAYRNKRPSAQPSLRMLERS